MEEGDLVFDIDECIIARILPIVPLESKVILNMQQCASCITCVESHKRRRFVGFCAAAAADSPMPRQEVDVGVGKGDGNMDADDVDVDDDENADELDGS